MSKYVVAIMSAAEVGALHHIITDELENGVLDVENQALLSNAQAKLDEALRTAGESLSPAVPASKPVKPHSPESFRAYECFKLQWMLDHKHTLQELLCELDAYSEDCGDAGSMQEPLVCSGDGRASESYHQLVGVRKKLLNLKLKGDTKMSENGCRVFPIITNAVQKEYEKCSMNTKSSDRTPEICGYYGRACGQMDKNEGANRMLCNHCPLVEVANSLRGGEGYRSVYQLTPDMLSVLKQKLFYDSECDEFQRLSDEERDSVASIAFYDQIPNEIVFHAFEGISFVDEDFFCGGCEEEAK